MERVVKRPVKSPAVHKKHHRSEISEKTEFKYQMREGLRKELEELRKAIAPPDSETWHFRITK